MANVPTVNAALFPKLLDEAKRVLSEEPDAAKAGRLIALHMDAMLTARCARRLYEHATAALEPEQRAALSEMLARQGDELYAKFLAAIGFGPGVDEIAIELEVPEKT